MTADQRPDDGSRRLGDDLDLPFERQALTEIDLDHAHIASGVAIMAALLPVPDAGVKPALVYRFANPDGSGFYPPMVLVTDDDQMAKLGPLTEAAAATAIEQASR